MPYRQFDRMRLKMKPLASRLNKKRIEKDCVTVDPGFNCEPGNSSAAVDECVERIRAARKSGRPVILAFGAHTIKNGLGPVLIRLMEAGWLTHLATNGAGIIHDWEFSFLGESSEDVRANVDRGEFGNWNETGYYINLAIAVGACEGMGYGESVGAMIQKELLLIPSRHDLKRRCVEYLEKDPGIAAAAADLLELVTRFNISPGRMDIPHFWKRFSAQAAAYRLGIPFTGHPMIGHDIIYNHPMNHGGAIGRAALRDFLTFASSVSDIEDGVYLSVGSAVMSPMIFEKSMSMAQNMAVQAGRHIERHYMLVVDLAESHWDWMNGEPPEDNPDYYLRYCKSFSRMGGTMRYLTSDNRDFLVGLCRRLGA